MRELTGLEPPSGLSGAGAPAEVGIPDRGGALRHWIGTDVNALAREHQFRAVFQAVRVEGEQRKGIGLRGASKGRSQQRGSDGEAREHGASKSCSDRGV